MEQAAQIFAAIFHESPLRLTFSDPVPGHETKRAVLRLVTPEKPNEAYFQLEKQRGTQVFHENVPENETLAMAKALFADFRRLNAATQTGEHDLRRTKKGRLLYQKLQKSPTPDAKISHNREKNYILKEGENIRPLQDLGIFTAEGKVAAAMFDKYRQINRFVELVDDVAAKDNREIWRIIDFGCGKSYLTFVLHYYFTKILGKKVEIVGLDLKQDVVDNCNRLAQAYGYAGLSFQHGDMTAYTPPFSPDLVISLHACDVATDFALAKGVWAKADYLFAVPCCQHEVAASVSLDKTALMADYGILKERFSALATDALRGAMLEYAGYKTQILEFIDLAHSPKNLLIRARRRKTPLPSAKKAQLTAKIQSLLAEIGTTPTLVELLDFAEKPNTPLTEQ